MKYSLRSLMVAVTLACLALAAVARRIDYLSRKADFHDRQFANSLGRLTMLTRYREDEIQALLDAFAEFDHDACAGPAEQYFFDHPDKETAKNRDKFASEWKAAYNHRRLAALYRHAVDRPFEFADESPPPPRIGIP